MCVDPQPCSGQFLGLIIKHNVSSRSFNLLTKLQSESTDTIPCDEAFLPSENGKMTLGQCFSVLFLGAPCPVLEVSLVQMISSLSSSAEV